MKKSNKTKRRNNIRYKTRRRNKTLNKTLNKTKHKNRRRNNTRNKRIIKHDGGGIRGAWERRKAAWERRKAAVKVLNKIRDILLNVNVNKNESEYHTIKTSCKGLLDVLNPLFIRKAKKFNLKWNKQMIKKISDSKEHILDCYDVDEDNIDLFRTLNESLYELIKTYDKEGVEFPHKIRKFMRKLDEKIELYRKVYASKK